MWDRIVIVLAAPVILVLLAIRAIQLIREVGDQSKRERADLESARLKNESSRLEGISEEVERRIQDLEAERDGVISDGSLEDFFNGRKK